MRGLTEGTLRGGKKNREMYAAIGVQVRGMPCHDRLRRTMDGHEYSGKFFEYINAGSLASARVVCPLGVQWLAPQRLLDVGCGAGAWCRTWAEVGVREVVGVDGPYVQPSSLLIPRSSFRTFDLSQPFDLGTRFDLVVSLEVAEHLPPASAGVFLDNLVRHGDRVLFSAAVPGQGGEFHVNEQPLEHWRQRFASQGYRCFDPLRPVIVGDARVEPWYRYNTLLYVKEASIDSLPSDVRDTEIPVGTDIPEMAPLTWTARRAVIRALPGVMVDILVKAKHEWGRRTRREGG